MNQIPLSAKDHDIVMFAGALGIFDLEATGHHYEFIFHMVKYRRYACSPIVLFIHPDVCDRLQRESEDLLRGITIICPGLDELEYFLSQKPLKRGFLELKWLRSTLAGETLGSLIFMALNRYQVGLSCPSYRRLADEILGIYLAPYLRMHGSGFLYMVRKERRRLQMVWMLSNQRINRIFVLNDSQSTAGLNARHRKKLFECLPDPVATHLLVKCEARSSPSWLPGKRGRFAFVLLGSLSRRKGLYLLAESIRQMPVDVQRRAIFVFAGAPPLDERDEVIAVLKELENHSEAEVVHKTDGFISDEVWWALLRFSDWVLLPYTRRDASSGVLGHAALAKRPVLVNAGGVVGELTSSYNLGHVIAGAKPEEWSDALTDIVAGKIKFTLHSRGREYVMERDPEAFARRIYESTGRN